MCQGRAPVHWVDLEHLDGSRSYWFHVPEIKLEMLHTQIKHISLYRLECQLAPVAPTMLPAPFSPPFSSSTT